MKRIRYFFVWTLMFWVLGLMAGSQFAVAYKSFEAQRSMQDSGDFRETLKTSLRSRATRGQVRIDFMMHYWHVVLACATLLAGIGSVTGGLPGTGKPKITEPPPLPPA